MQSGLFLNRKIPKRITRVILMTYERDERSIKGGKKCLRLSRREFQIYQVLYHFQPVQKRCPIAKNLVLSGFPLLE